jgi:ElaB/YqjD/DUF883 family membrane-anchored ribosome-binding protein
MTPLQVSERFWLGIKKKNHTLITNNSVSNSELKSDDVEQLPDITKVTFGKITIDKKYSEIETDLTMLIDNKPSSISVKTILINEKNEWKVDYEKTMLPFVVNQQMSELFGGIQELTESFADEVEESVEDFKNKAIPEIKSKLEEAEKELRQKLPELKNMIDQFLQDLEKSIEEAMPEPEEEEATTRET